MSDAKRRSKEKDRELHKNIRQKLVSFDTCRGCMPKFNDFTPVLRHSKSLLAPLPNSRYARHFFRQFQVCCDVKESHTYHRVEGSMLYQNPLSVNFGKKKLPAIQLNSFQPLKTGLFRSIQNVIASINIIVLKAIKRFLHK